MKMELADARLYCAEGIAEAEACGDVEMQAQFLMQAVMLNTLEGTGVDDTRQVIQVSGTLHFYMFNFENEVQGHPTCSSDQSFGDFGLLP